VSVKYPVAGFYVSSACKNSNLSCEICTDSFIDYSSVRTVTGGTAAAAPPPSGLATLPSVGAVP